MWSGNKWYDIKCKADSFFFIDRSVVKVITETKVQEEFPWRIYNIYVAEELSGGRPV